MKTRLFSLLLAAVLAGMALTGCRVAETVQSAGQAVEQGVESIGDSVKDAMDTTTATKDTTPVLTAREAQQIALKHAGLTTDQVTALRSEYEIEDGIPEYDVEFHHGSWEYDYEIHAKTGEVLSFSKDERP